MLDRANILHLKESHSDTDGLFYKNHFNTIGVSFYIWKKKINSSNVVFQIWNINEKHRFSSIQELHTTGSIGLILSYDVTERLDAEDLYKLIHRYLIYNKVEPHIIVLYGYMPAHDLSSLSDSTLNHIHDSMNDVEYLIQEEWGIAVLSKIVSSDLSEFDALLFDSASTVIARLVEPHQVLVEKKLHKIELVINQLTTVFPSLRERIYLEDNYIHVVGSLQEYMLDYKATAFIKLPSEKKFLCLTDPHTNTYERYSLSLQSIRSLFPEPKFTLHPSILLILGKIFYLLNDKHYYNHDPIFKKQLIKKV